MQNVKRKHHTTPAFYLKGFTRLDSPQEIYVFQPRKAPFCTGVTGVGFETDFYTVTYKDGTKDTNTVENNLAELVERPANQVIRKLRNRQLPTASEKFELARYMSVMLTRVPKHRERMKGLFPRVANDVEAELKKEIAEAATTNPTVAQRMEQLQNEVTTILDEYRGKIPDWLQVGAVSDKYAALLNAMHWVFFTTTTSRKFLTSDNPVFFFEGVGLLGPDESRELPELSFPISRDIALWATWRRSSQDFVAANERIVMEINRRTISASLRFVYHGSTPKWVQALVNKDKAAIKLNRIILL